MSPVSRHTPLNPYWLCVNRSSTNSRVGAAHEYQRCLLHTALLSWISGRVVSSAWRKIHSVVNSFSLEGEDRANGLFIVDSTKASSMHSRSFVAGMRPETSSDTQSGLASRMQSCSPVKAPPLPFAHFYGTSISRNPPWSSWARSSIMPTWGLGASSMSR